jgi:hypothetical protein
MPEFELTSSLSRVRDPQYREVYSNNSQTTLGAFDISITFQRLSEILPGQQAIVDQVFVTLSPQHFKGLVRSLNETLSAYETAFGKLNIQDTETIPQKSAIEIVETIDAARRAKSSMSSSTEPPQHKPLSRDISREKGKPT